MCGITGVFTYKQEAPEHLAAVDGMMALMRRRGPDDAGRWTDGRHAVLGFRRLAILDLSAAGHQPMISACGRHVLVFNGEVYNFRELRQELEGLGHRFRSNCDTEVVLAALTEWAEAALPRFNGMFALAWYDHQERRLLLARDPFGIKPLYYLESPRGLVFGSQYDQLIRHPFCTRRLRPECLGLYLRLGYIPPPDGLFQSTWMLPPGEALRISPDERPTRFRYHTFPTESAELSDEKHAGEEVAAAVRNAVRRQMVSDVPLGVFLSGGVDSPLVAAHARAVKPDVQAFTIGCTDPRFDESEIAEAYGQALGLRRHVEQFGPEECLSLVAEGARAYSEPFADYSSLPSLLLCRTTRQAATVALSGDGGDELFFGYPRFWKIGAAAHYFRWSRVVRAAAYLRSRVTGGGIPRGVLFSDPGAWQFDGHCFSGLRSRDLRALCPEALSLPADFHQYRFDDLAESDAVCRWLRQNELWGHLQMVLLKMDRASMHYSLEVRVPLLDLEVAAAAARTPPASCIRDGIGKLPLRHALAKHVPPQNIPKRKAGFSVPLGDWLRGELRPAVEDLLLSGDAYPDGLFHRPTLRSLYDDHLQGSDRSHAIWRLLSLQFWAREHLRKPPFACAQR